MQNAYDNPVPTARLQELHTTIDLNCVLKFCTQLYKIQVAAGRYFLHEHPDRATSWRLPYMRARRPLHVRLERVEERSEGTCQEAFALPDKFVVPRRGSGEEM